MLIAIDGYNFIKQVQEFRRLEQIELQKAREGLVAKLAEYKRLKGHAVMVVFDGQQTTGRLTGHRERSRGIEVVFSKPGESADDVLKHLAQEKREGITVVTSDQAVAHFASKKGAAVLAVGDFAEKMEMARLYAFKGGEEENAPFLRPVAPAKKGPSRRLSKSKRKTLAIRKKL
jgi:uncharacterized protein